MAMKKIFVLLLLCIYWFLGCSAQKTVIVLLPDPDGHFGELEIRNKKGSSSINRAGYSVSVSSGKAPKPSVMMAEKEIRRVFADALAAEPPPPAKFILYFLWDSTDLTPESRSSIKEIIAEIENRSSTDIQVTGHTDRSGTKEFNLVLSRRRAEKVRDRLVAEGVALETISMAFHGEENPLIQTAENVPEPRNRRVEVIVR